MNYIDTIASRVGTFCGMGMRHPGEADLLRIYAVLVLTVGAGTTLENVHDAWSAWRSQTQPDHKSLVPFSDLAEDVKQLDAPYRDAIVKVANELRDPAGGTVG